MLQRRGIMLQVVDANAGGGALCCRGGALCFKWRGIMIQVVDANHDANAGGGASCFGGGALCFHSHPPLEA